MAQLQKGQSYGNMGFRVDDKGIAYDIATGKSLAKSDVNARLAKEGSGISNLDTKRGGVTGFYDANKKWVNPVLEAGLGMIPGVGVGLATAYGAAAGANSIKNPNLTGALMGVASGYGMGKLGGSARDGLGKLVTGGGGAPTPVPAYAGTLSPQSVTEAYRAAGVASPMASIADAGRGVLGRVTDFGRGALDKAGDLANWAEKHPIALKAGEGLVKGMMPASGLDQAKEEQIRKQTELEELERQQRAGAAAGNTAQRNALSAQLAALMAGSRAPALSNYGR